MSKKEEIKSPTVYRPARIQNEIDNGLNKLVEKGKYKSYNAALNGELKKILKIGVKRFSTLKDLRPGDKFKFKRKGSFRIFVVLEHCKATKNKVYKTRKCKEVDSDRFIYPSCKKEIVKL